MKKTAIMAAILLIAFAFCAFALADSSSCAHNFGEWKSANGAQHSRVCGLCGVAQTETHNLLGETTTVATCTQKQVITYTCSVCKYSYTVQLDFAPHTYVAWVSDGKGNHTKTCTVAGCGNKVTEKCVNFSNVSSTPANCKQKATVTDKCNDCGYQRTTETGAIDPNAHKWNNWVTTAETHTSTCALCNKANPGNGNHTYSAYTVTKNATCSDYGEMTATCTVCAYKDVKTTALDPNNHSFTQNKMSSDADKHFAICNCGAITQSGESHSWDTGKVTQAATCAATGSRLFTCTKTGCGRTRTEVIPIDNNNHPGIKWSYNETTHTWTCSTCNGTGTGNHTLTGWKMTNTSKHANSCTDKCGYAVTQDHTWSAFTQTVQATCSQKGEKVRTCAVCGGVDKQTIKSPKHDYGKFKKYNELYHEKTCKVCKEVMRQQHKFEDVSITREATATKEGLKVVQCSVCNFKTNQKIPLLGSQPTKEIEKKDYVHVGTAKLDRSGTKEIEYADGASLAIEAIKACSIKAYAVDGDDEEEIVGLEITKGSAAITVNGNGRAKTLDFITLAKGTELTVKMEDGEGSLIIQNCNEASLIISSSKTDDGAAAMVIQSAINAKNTIINGSCICFVDENGELKLTRANDGGVKAVSASGAKTKNHATWTYTIGKKNINISALNADGTYKGIVYTLNVNDASVNVVKDQKKAAGKISGTADDIFDVNVVFADGASFSTPQYYLGGRIAELEPDVLSGSGESDEKPWDGSDENSDEGETENVTEETNEPDDIPPADETPAQQPTVITSPLSNPWDNYEVLPEDNTDGALQIGDTQSDDLPPEGAIGIKTEFEDVVEDKAATVRISLSNGQLIISVTPTDGYTFRQTRLTQVMKGGTFSVNMLTSLNAEDAFQVTGCDSAVYAEIFLRDAGGTTVSVKTDTYDLTTK